MCHTHFTVIVVDCHNIYIGLLRLVLMNNITALLKLKYNNNYYYIVVNSN